MSGIVLSVAISADLGVRSQRLGVGRDGSTPFEMRKGPIVAVVGQIWPTSAQSPPSLVDSRPKLVLRPGHVRPCPLGFGRALPQCGRSPPSCLPDPWAGIVRTLPNIGRTRSTCGRIWATLGSSLAQTGPALAEPHHLWPPKFGRDQSALGRSYPRTRTRPALGLSLRLWKSVHFGAGSGPQLCRTPITRASSSRGKASSRVRPGDQLWGSCVAGVAPEAMRAESPKGQAAESAPQSSELHLAQWS